MVELRTDPAAGDGIRPWVTTRGVTRVVAIVVAVTATALWMSVAWGNRNPYSQSGIGAMMLTGLLAVMLPLALRPNRPSQGTPDDGARITAVAAAAVLVIGSVAFADHYAVAARFGDGTRGTLEVEMAECSGTCDWSGFFWVRHGPHGKLVLNDWATLADGPGQGLLQELNRQELNRRSIPAVDVTNFPAIDVGDPNQVYLLGGGSQWAQVKTIAVADSTAACSLIAAVLLLRYRRSRRYRRINASLAPVRSGCSFTAVPGRVNTPGQGPASLSRSATETRCGPLAAAGSTYLGYVELSGGRIELSSTHPRSIRAGHGVAEGSL